MKFLSDFIMPLNHRLVYFRKLTRISQEFKGHQYTFINNNNKLFTVTEKELTDTFFFNSSRWIEYLITKPMYH